MSNKKGRLGFRELAGILVLLTVAGVLALPAIRTAGDRKRITGCQNQLRQWGQIMRIFASEHEGRYPGRFIDYVKQYSPDLGFWSEIDYSELHPDYIQDLGLAFCPAAAQPPEEWNDPKAGYGYPAISGYRRGIDSTWADDPLDTPIRKVARQMREAQIAQAQADAWCRDANPDNDQYCAWRLQSASFNYWGWMVCGAQVANPEDMYEMGRVIDNDLDDRSPTNPGCTVARRFQDFEITLPKFGKTQVRFFREGVERFMITDLQNPAMPAQTTAQLALMWDKATASADLTAALPKTWAHHPTGLNVLFMDGHAEFASYPQPDGSAFWMASEAAMFDKMIWWP